MEMVFINVQSNSQLQLNGDNFTISSWVTHSEVNNLDKNIIVKSDGTGLKINGCSVQSFVNNPSGLGFASNQQFYGGSQGNITLNNWRHYLLKNQLIQLSFS